MTYFDDLIIHLDRFYDIYYRGKNNLLQMHTFVVAKLCSKHK